MRYTLVRDNDGLIKESFDAGWVEWTKDDRFEEKHEDIAIGRSLILAPFSIAYTWLTTRVTKILEESDKKIIFETENSKYTLTWQD
jgi:hypothetical protein